MDLLLLIASGLVGGMLPAALYYWRRNVKLDREIERMWG